MVHCAKGKAYFLWTIMHGMYTYEATLVGPQALWLAQFSGDVGFSSSTRESLLFQRKKEEEDEPLEAVRKYNDSGKYDTNTLI